MDFLATDAAPSQNSTFDVFLLYSLWFIFMFKVFYHKNNIL